MEKPPILVVDDDAEVRDMLRNVLDLENYPVVEAGNGDEMRAATDEQDFGLIILDLRLPGEDGFSLAREIRTKSDVPIIMLTGRDDVIDKVAGLEAGADDYVTKPFHARELTARISTILRRHHPVSASERDSDSPVDRVAHFNGWELNISTHQLTSPGGENVPITTYEFEILTLFVERSKHPLSRDQILDILVGRERDPFDRSVDVRIAQLRKKLGDSAGNPQFIKTIRNHGYMFIADVKFSDS